MIACEWPKFLITHVLRSKVNLKFIDSFLDLKSFEAMIVMLYVILF